MLLSILKRETRSNHEALEAQVDVHSCLASPRSWLWLIATFYGYCAPLERLIFSDRDVARWLPDSDKRLRSHLLAKDIDALGGDAGRVPFCPELPALQSVGERLGSLYVLEGSTLGGQVIARLATRQGYTPERGCAYFSGHSDKVGTMWKNFCQALEAFGTAHPETEDAMIASAVQTFASFEGWIVRRKRELAGADDYTAKR